ncbi:MAG: 6,7-dimethyl-8-ribityllumazine synthase [Vicinamibacterales bacterium]
MAQELQGSRHPDGTRFAIVVARFNDHVTSGLLRGARSALADAGVRDEDVTIVHVPGAFEIPLTALRLAESRRYAAVICLGCLIKGDTMHFEYIATATSNGIMDAATATGVPMSFGVLTTLDEDQALMRAADGPGNKGGEAARAALEMATLMPQIARGNERMQK